MKTIKQNNKIAAPLSSSTTVREKPKFELPETPILYKVRRLPVRVFYNPMPEKARYFLIPDDITGLYFDGVRYFKLENSKWIYHDGTEDIPDNENLEYIKSNYQECTEDDIKTANYNLQEYRTLMHEKYGALELKLLENKKEARLKELIEILNPTI